jgi:hypothetical protein
MGVIPALRPSEALAKKGKAGIQSVGWRIVILNLFQDLDPGQARNDRNKVCVLFSKT